MVCGDSQTGLSGAPFGHQPDILALESHAVVIWSAKMHVKKLLSVNDSKLTICTAFSCCHLLSLLAITSTNQQAMASSGSTGERWKDCERVCPTAQEIAVALQDTGKKEAVKKKGAADAVKHKFSSVQKLAARIHVSTQKQFGNPDGLTKNVSRGKIPLAKEITLSRRHVDVSETDPFSIHVMCKARCSSFPTTVLPVVSTKPQRTSRTAFPTK